MQVTQPAKQTPDHELARYFKAEEARTQTITSALIKVAQITTAAINAVARFRPTYLVLKHTK